MLQFSQKGGVFMLEAIRQFKNAHPQTKIFILMLVIYMGAIIWTTIQSYARLQNTGATKCAIPIIINIPQDHT